MDTIFANKLFEDKTLLNSLHIEENKHINLDFSDVQDFNLKSLYTLLDLQKLALFNNAELHITNTTPCVDKVLFETGIYKTLSGFTTNPILSRKRLSFT